MILSYELPFQGVLLLAHFTPQALPWARLCCAFSAYSHTFKIQNRHKIAQEK